MNEAEKLLAVDKIKPFEGRRGLAYVAMTIAVLAPTPFMLLIARPAAFEAFAWQKIILMSIAFGGPSLLVGLALSFMHLPAELDDKFAHPLAINLMFSGALHAMWIQYSIIFISQIPWVRAAINTGPKEPLSWFYVMFVLCVCVSILTGILMQFFFGKARKKKPD